MKAYCTLISFKIGTAYVRNSIWEESIIACRYSLSGIKPSEGHAW
jgi:hypothetical protein